MTTTVPTVTSNTTMTHFSSVTNASDEYYYYYYYEYDNETLYLYDDLDSFYDDLIRPIFGISIGILGLPTTLVLLAVTITPPYRKHSYSLYLTTMCVYDFMFVLVNLLNSVLELLYDKVLRDVLILEVPCRLYEYIWYASMLVSIWLNVAVAVDRYLIIAFPFKKNDWCNRKTSWIVCTGLIVIVHSIGIVYLVYGKVEKLSNDKSYCNGQYILHDIDLYLSDLAGVVPAIILIVIFSALSVTKLALANAKQQEMTSQPNIRGSPNTRATVALVGIGVCAFVTQIPYVTNEVVKTYAYQNDFHLYQKLWNGSMPEYETAIKVFEGIKFINNIQNFYVFYALNSQFRQDVAKLFKPCISSTRKIYLRSRRQSATSNTSGSARTGSTV